MIWNALLLALREIRRNVLRSVLTILGVVIGVAAVIVMVTLGNGATRAVASQIESLGSNLLMIRMGQHMGPGQGSSAPPFSLADTVALARDIPAIRQIAPSASDLSSSGTARCQSTWNRVPMPLQVVQAPYGLLNEKLRGCNSSNDRPQCSQARCWLNVSDGPSTTSTAATPSASRRAVSSESVSRRSIPSRRTSRSTITSIV